ETDDGAAPLKVRVEQPGITNALVNTSTSLVASTAVLIALLYFLLAEGDRFLEKLVFLMPTFQEKKNVVELTRAIQKTISNYLMTITIINMMLGTTIGLAMWALGLPNPALWGVLACLLNYIPF